MKKFIFSIAILICGTLLFCSTFIAKGIYECGSNPSGRYDSAITFFMVVSIVIIIIGLVISFKNLKEKKNI